MIMPCPSKQRRSRVLATSYLLLCLVTFPRAVRGNREEITFDQKDDSICARSPDLQIMNDDINPFDCQMDERRRAFNCSNKFIPALPKTAQLPRGVEVLDFSNNRIKCLPKINNTVTTCDVANCSQGCIRQLYLQNNEINFLHDETFTNLTCLQFLDLSKNEISSRSLNKLHFVKQSNLLHLNLHGNPLGSLSDSVLMSTYLSHLQYLNLSKCQLSTLGPSSLDDFHELQTLDLSTNELAILPAGTFRGLSMLKTLDLRWNRLERIDQDTFASLTQLEDLRLTNNLLKQISERAFSKPPPPLRVLDLRYNTFTDLPVSALAALGQLGVLDMSYNTVTELGPRHGITTIQDLRLDFLSLLQTVREDAFSPFPLLTSLSLRYAGQLRTISATAFRGSSANLSQVRLDHNALVSLPQDLLPWAQLSYLTLHDNPWNCSCSASWMMELLMIDIRCQDPAKLRGQALSDLAPDELSCPKPLLLAQTVIALAINVAAVVVIAIVLWHMRRQLPCKWLRGTAGRYVMVFTKERRMKEEADSGNASGGEGETDELDLDLGSGSASGCSASVRSRARDGVGLHGEREEGEVEEEREVADRGGRVSFLFSTFRNGYRRLTRRVGESSLNLTLTADV